MNTMRAGVTGAALLALAAVTACGTSGGPAHASSTSAASSAASPTFYRLHQGVKIQPTLTG